MSLSMNEAISELQTAYAGLRGKAFFSNKIISEKLLIDPSTFGKKRKGSRSFNQWEFVQIARHFGLGEDGARLFRLESAIQFRNALKESGIGIYSGNPVVTLCAHLLDCEKQTSATLDFYELEHAPRHRGGFERLPPADTNSIKHLASGASTRFKFSSNFQTNRQFALLNQHVESNTLSVISPISKSDVRPVAGTNHYFPETDRISIHREVRLGAHRLFALSATEKVTHVLISELDRLRINFLGASTADLVDINIGQFELDDTAAQRIRSAIDIESVICAVLDYEQI